MGCFNSRFDDIKGELDNYNTLQASFVPALPNSLSPIDNLEHAFKDSLPTKEYGEWKARIIDLDDKLQLLDNETVKAYCETA